VAPQPLLLRRHIPGGLVDLAIVVLYRGDADHRGVKLADSEGRYMPARSSGFAGATALLGW